MIDIVYTGPPKSETSKKMLNHKFWRFTLFLYSKKCRITKCRKKNVKNNVSGVFTICNDQSKGRAKVCNWKVQQMTPGQSKTSDLKFCHLTLLFWTKVCQHFIIWHIALWHFVILHFFWHIALRHFAMHLLFVYLTNVKTVPLKI